MNFYIIWKFYAPKKWSLEPIYEQKNDFYIANKNLVLLIMFTTQSRENI